MGGGGEGESLSLSPLFPMCPILHIALMCLIPMHYGGQAIEKAVA